MQTWQVGKLGDILDFSIKVKSDKRQKGLLSPAMSYVTERQYFVLDFQRKVHLLIKRRYLLIYEADHPQLTKSLRNHKHAVQMILT